jgi:hypothetical protein
MRKLFPVIVLLLIVVFAANHVEQFLRSRENQKDPAGEGVAIAVKTEPGEGEHFEIAVDEGNLKLPGKEPVVRFSDLRSWTFDPVKKNEPPEAVKALHGKRVAVAGFMEARGDEAMSFSLIRAHHPGEEHGARKSLEPNERIRIDLPDPVPVERTRPVLVRGRFFTDPKPVDGYLCRVEGESLETAGLGAPAGVPEAGPVLPTVDFFWLEDMEVQDSRGGDVEFPEAFLALDGKRVRIEGFIVDRDNGPPESILVGRHYWDGCCTGVRPTYFNSLLVVPREGEAVPSPWVARGAYAGTLKLNRDEADWVEWGVGRIENALARPLSNRGEGPHIPVWVEAVLLIVVVLVGASRTAPGERREAGAADGEATPGTDAAEGSA